MTSYIHNTTSPLLAIAPGPTRIESSSAGSSWRGLLLEKHITLPGERISASVDRHVISMLSGPCSRFEFRNTAGDTISCWNRAGSITITPAGPVPDLRLLTSSELIHCALDENYIRGVLEETNQQAGFSPMFRPCLQDESLRRIIGLLLEELETNQPSGMLYIDSLTHALATRYLLLTRLPDRTPAPRVAGLPARILNRVREKIHANLDTNISLESLAEESGYSRAHFLRMFRVATGLTPHQFILELRLRRAQDCLCQKNASMIDIALSCGFSSQSHMTSVFRQRLEMTPGEFRRWNRIAS